MEYDADAKIFHPHFHTSNPKRRENSGVTTIGGNGRRGGRLSGVVIFSEKFRGNSRELVGELSEIAEISNSRRKARRDGQFVG